MGRYNDGGCPEKKVLEAFTQGIPIEGNKKPLLVIRDGEGKLVPLYTQAAVNAYQEKQKDPGTAHSAEKEGTVPQETEPPRSIAPPASATSTPDPTEIPESVPARPATPTRPRRSEVGTRERPEEEHEEERPEGREERRREGGVVTLEQILDLKGSAEVFVKMYTMINDIDTTSLSDEDNNFIDAEGKPLGEWSSLVKQVKDAYPGRDRKNERIQNLALKLLFIRNENKLPSLKGDHFESKLKENIQGAILLLES